jgi:DNA-directed RNA polymerase beta subunit
MYELIVPEARRGGELDAHMRPILEHARVGVAALVARMLPSCVTARRIALQRALESDLLPHIGHGADAASTKAFVLAHATQRVLEVALGLTPQDDRDNYARKRADGCGALLGRWPPG